MKLISERHEKAHIKVSLRQKPVLNVYFDEKQK